jgi:hypothetical protein
MSRGGTRRGVDGATRQEVGAVAGSQRVGGRYVPKVKVRYEHRGIRMKSSYEVNYAAFLDYLGIPWLYEPKRFIFEKIISGTRTYTPDFYLPKSDEYHETKGYFDRKSRTQLKRMRIHHPKVEVIVIDTPFFTSVCKQRLCRAISGWRCRHTQGG